LISTLTNITALVERDGEITLGHLDAIGKCVATATDGAQCLAMLVRRKGESLEALLRRLDAAIVDVYENEHYTDEINVPTSSGSHKPRR
jgi:hypothetical protein